MNKYSVEVDLSFKLEVHSNNKRNVRGFIHDALDKPELKRIIDSGGYAVGVVSVNEIDESEGID